MLVGEIEETAIGVWIVAISCFSFFYLHSELFNWQLYQTHLAASLHSWQKWLKHPTALKYLPPSLIVEEKTVSSNWSCCFLNLSAEWPPTLLWNWLSKVRFCYRWLLASGNKRKSFQYLDIMTISSSFQVWFLMVWSWRAHSIVLDSR